MVCNAMGMPSTRLQWAGLPGCLSYSPFRHRRDKGRLWGLTRGLTIPNHMIQHHTMQCHLNTTLYQIMPGALPNKSTAYDDASSIYSLAIPESHTKLYSSGGLSNPRTNRTCGHTEEEESHRTSKKVALSHHY